MKVESFIDQFSRTEGNDCSDWPVRVDIGSDVWQPALDEPFVEYDFDNKICWVRRRRTIINPPTQPVQNVRGY